jgi:hypothetical protein
LTRGGGLHTLWPTMMGRIAGIAALVAVLTVAPSYARAAEPLPQKPPERGVVVLRNGETIEGRITHADGFYVVDLPDAQIRLKETDVEMVCGSLDEGYRRKRAVIQVGNVSQHLELAQWCLRHNLLGQAAVELADAKTADPNNPMVAALQQRLRMATEPPPAADAKSAAVPGPNNEELDRMVRGLPRGAVESFTQAVQPMLMNHCTGSGCHGPQSATGMKLIRIAGGKSPSRRFTQRNLYSVLHYVDQGNPAASRLLTAAGGPHGPVQHAIFSEHEAAQFKRLVEWVSQVSGHEMPEAPATVTRAAPPAMDEHPAAGPSPKLLPGEARKAHPMTPADRAKGRRPSSRPPSKTPPKDSPEAESPPSRQPAGDPFDPEIFNRRRAPEQPPAKN